VVEGLAAGWPAIETWTPAYLKSMAGTVEVSVRETAGSPRNIYQNLTEGGRIPFAEYVDWVAEVSNAPDVQAILSKWSDPARITCAIGDCHFSASYYLDAKLHQLSPAMMGDVAIPRWYGHDPIDIIFWLGILGTSSGLHSDVTPNCNVQIAGNKHFILFPPSQAKRLYQIPGRTHCRFDPNMPDYGLFPDARNAFGFDVYLKPGEALYIPVGWFHQVTVVSRMSINVNFFWRRQFPQGLATPPLWRILLGRAWARTRRTLAPTRASLSHLG
jgi:hypothetical protein